MKKLFVLGCLLLASARGFAAGSAAQVKVASDYNWRGLSWTASGVPATQGSIMYNSDFGLGGGLFASNIAIGHQINEFVYYWFQAGPVGITAMVNNFQFTDALMSGFDAVDISVKASWMGLDFLLSDMPNYFGTKTGDIYASLGYTWKVDGEFSVIPSVGSSNFSDAKKTVMLAPLGFDNNSYIDYKIAADHTKDGWTAEVAFTNTTRKHIDALGNTTKIKDDYKTYFSIAKAF